MITKYRTLTAEHDASTQYATVYAMGRPIGTLQRRRVISREPWNWQVFDLNGKLIANCMTVIMCLIMLWRHVQA